MGKKILIIEQDTSISYLLAFLLKHHKFETMEAHNGMDGLTKAINSKPDTILIDINIQITGGFEGVIQFRKVEHLKNTPVILISSYDPHEYKYINGADGAIQMPLNPNTFLLQMESILSK